VTELIEQGATHQVEVVVDQLTPEGLEHLRPLSDKVVTQGGRVMVVLRSPQQVDSALDVIRASKAKLVSLTPHKSSLEELFIREARGMPAHMESRS
jgi:ABC-2 type transport system ATP-binding protein